MDGSGVRQQGKVEVQTSVQDRHNKQQELIIEIDWRTSNNRQTYVPHGFNTDENKDETGDREYGWPESKEETFPLKQSVAYQKWSNRNPRTQTGSWEKPQWSCLNIYE